MNSTNEKVCGTVLQALHASSGAAKGTSKDTIHFNSKPYTDYMTIQQVNTVKTGDLTTCRHFVATSRALSTRIATIPKD